MVKEGEFGYKWEGNSIQNTFRLFIENPIFVLVLIRCINETIVPFRSVGFDGVFHAFSGVL